MAPDRKSTQRQRLIDGLIATAGRDGYANTNIARIHKAAGVSRRTYYEYFPDRDACSSPRSNRSATSWWARSGPVLRASHPSWPSRAP